MASTMDPYTSTMKPPVEGQAEMVALDFVILALYFLFVLAVGLAVSMHLY